MRYQRRAPVTVRLVQRTEQEDALGNITDVSDPVTTDVPGALFEPQTVLERQGENAVPVIRPAAWSVPGAYLLDSDDQVLLLDTTTDPATVLETWEVVGGSAIWLDRTVVPAQLVTRDVTPGES